MRLYLSSMWLGNAPEHWLGLLNGRRRIAVILNAVDGKTPIKRVESLHRELDSLRGLGLQPEEVDLRKFFGRPTEIAGVLAQFDGLWVRGGNTFVLRRALRQSGADAVIVDLVARDAIVYGGFSAGACVLAPTLRGIELVDGPHDLPDGYEPEVPWDGLGLIPYHLTCHYRSDHPESDAVDRHVEHLIANHVPFIALKDGEAIVRDAAGERVVGSDDSSAASAHQ